MAACKTVCAELGSGVVLHFLARSRANHVPPAEPGVHDSFVAESFQRDENQLFLCYTIIIALD
jgi:hypothetical protein